MRRVVGVVTLLCLLAVPRASATPSVAQAWAEHLAAVDEESHNPQLRPQMENALGSLDEVAENVGFCTCTDPSVITAFWHASPTHASNLNKTWDVIDKGQATSASGRVYVVWDFAVLSPPLTWDTITPTTELVPIPPPTTLPHRPSQGLIPAIAITPPPATAARFAAQQEAFQNAE